MIFVKEGRSRELLPKMPENFRFFELIIIIRRYKSKKDLDNCSKTLFLPFLKFK